MNVLPGILITCCIIVVLLLGFKHSVTLLVISEMNASLHVSNVVYIALGYTVNDAPILSTLKSPTTVAAVPEQE